MAKRGDVARDKVKNIIITAFGENFVGIVDKKIYVTAKDESGEEIQFAITMTMPKSPIGAADGSKPSVNTNDWTGTVTESVTPSAPETSKEDEEKVAELMKMLGIVD